MADTLLARVRAVLRRAGAPDGRFLLLVAPLIALGLALWMTVPDWGPRPPGGDDTMAHVIRAQFASSHLINHLRVDGWDPSFIVGYQEFLFDGPGLSWAVYIARLITLNTLSFVGAVKVVAVGSFVVLPLSVAFMARSFGLGRRAAGLSAILSLAIDSPFGGVGLQGLFSIGLVTNQLGAVFFFLAFGCLLRATRHGGARWVVLSGVSLCLLTVTHGISVMILGVMLMIIVVLWVVGLQFPTAPAFYDRVAARMRTQLSQGRGAALSGLDVPSGYSLSEPDGHVATHRWPRLGYLVGATLLGFALGAVVLLPLYGLRALRGPLSGWSTPPLGQRLLQIWQGLLLLRPGVAPFLVAGAVYGLVRVWKARPYALPVAATPIVFLIVAHTAFHYWPSNVVSMQLANRGLGYDGVLAILPLSALIARATRPMLYIRDGVAVLLAVALVVLPMGSERQEAQQMPAAVPQMHQAAAVLNSVVPPSARFALERDVPIEVSATGVPQPDHWLAWASGRNILDSFNVESSIAAGVSNVPYDITSEPPAEVADQLARLGVTDLVTISDQSANRIGSSPRFKKIWQASPLAVFAVLPSPGQPPPAALITANGPLDAKLIVGEPEHDEIAVSALAPMTATIAIAYSPKWHATLNGKAAALTKTPDGMLEVALPAGPERLDLRFEEDIWDYLGTAVSCVTALGLIAVVVLRRRRRHRVEPGAAAVTETADAPSEVDGAAREALAERT